MFEKIPSQLNKDNQKQDVGDLVEKIIFETGKTKDAEIRKIEKAIKNIAETGSSEFKQEAFDILNGFEHVPSLELLSETLKSNQALLFAQIEQMKLAGKNVKNFEKALELNDSILEKTAERIVASYVRIAEKLNNRSALNVLRRKIIENLHISSEQKMEILNKIRKSL